MIDTVVVEYIIHINMYHTYSVKGDVVVVVKIREEMEIFLWVLPVGS
jgi:hypothetical protein